MQVPQGGESVDRRVDFRFVGQEKIGGFGAGSGGNAHRDKKQDDKKRDVFAIYVHKNALLHRKCFPYVPLFLGRV